MDDVKADFTMTFRSLSELTINEQNDPDMINKHWALTDLSMHKRWKEWLKKYHKRLRQYVVTRHILISF